MRFREKVHEALHENIRTHREGDTLNMTTIFNPFMVWLLRSPLHKLASKNTLLITFTGRKSGKKYTTPVNYASDKQYARYSKVNFDPDGHPNSEDIAHAAEERVMILLKPE